MTSQVTAAAVKRLEPQSVVILSDFESHCSGSEALVTSQVTAAAPQSVVILSDFESHCSGSEALVMSESE